MAVALPTLLFSAVGATLAYAILRYIRTKKERAQTLEVEYEKPKEETPLEKEIPAEEWEKE